MKEVIVTTLKNKKKFEKIKPDYLKTARYNESIETSFNKIGSVL